MGSSKRVLLLFSAGRDSMLAASLLAEQHYQVAMVTFDNGAELFINKAKLAAERIINRYGPDRVSFIGIGNTAGIWQEFQPDIYNSKISFLIEEYGDLTISQINCLTCRFAMYVWAILYALRNNITLLAEGARQDQGFFVELPLYFKKLNNFLSGYGLNLLLPVYNLRSNQERKYQLLTRGFVPKSLEPQCLIGVPLPDGLPPDSDEQRALASLMENILFPKARQMIERYRSQNIELPLSRPLL